VIAAEQMTIKRIADARTDPDKLPFGEQARAKQQELDAKLAELREGGDAKGAERFWRAEYAAFHNAASTEDQLCEECGAVFEIGATRPSRRKGSRLPVYCSSGCRSKAANRGRPPRDHRSVIAKVERARLENSEKWRQHAQGCTRCQSGEPCPEAAGYEAFATGVARPAPTADALARGRTVPLRGNERTADDGQS
jgi:hypothetical protein